MPPTRSASTWSGGQHIIVDTEWAVLDVDRALISRAVVNLLRNALDHNQGDARAWVHLRPVPSGALLVVEDDGPGVPDEDKPAVFQRHTRVGAARTTRTQHGVGLSLVKAFVDMHGGHVWVEDRPGGGASFRIWLPGQATAEPAP